MLRGPNGQPVRDPETGRYILANSPADATTYRKATAAYQDARAQISEYDRLLKSYGREPSLFGVKSEGRQKMEAQYGRVKRSIVVLDDLGALTGSDYSSLGQSVPPPPGLTTLQVNQQWSKPLLSQLDGKIDADIGQLGYSGSYAKDAQNLVSHKSGDISGKPPGERDAEANEAARGQAGLEPTGTDSEPLYVQIGGATHELTNDDRTRKMLSSGKAKLSTPKQIQQYQVLNFASGEEPAEPVAETPAKKPAKKSKADAAADEEKKRKRAAMTHEAAD